MTCSAAVHALSCQLSPANTERGQDGERKLSNSASHSRFGEGAGNQLGEISVCAGKYYIPV